MALIDSVSSAGAAALQPFQPRSLQGDTGTDNPSVQQFQQQLQTPPAIQPGATQTPGAVQQPEPPQNPPPPQPVTGNAPGSNAQSLSEILREASERQAANNEPSSSPSAVNYNANGTPNAAQRPTQAGQLVSLSV
ncbi:MAG TPA: hypothetical protein VKZ87_10530 [Ferrovibrio sp.]|jgi:hypothetical protein|uniref:hypothetical protein n=1 Tax=Ferrovibrio sp. TaxID=1917215 RepID=UPI002B4B87E9|nr:hypothetical protein [Ferrovibrio sp.]HLT77812.1 hypothetical protein [Ferrovibrio sp.]